jgi:hypothetical protein
MDRVMVDGTSWMMSGGYGQKKYVQIAAQCEEQATRYGEQGAPFGFIERPETLVKKAEALLCSQVWEEVVVGLALVSGRCMLEVLKTGVIMPKTRYALVFTASNEPADQMVGPCEIPTLVEAQRVLSAWQWVRSVMACEAMVAQEINARYRLPIVQAAKVHFARRVPVASPLRDWYTPLYAQIYPLIAARYYCPKGIDARYYAALVRGLEWPASPSMQASAWDACVFCQQSLRPRGVYYVGDGVNGIDGARGLRLDQEGVEPRAFLQVPSEGSLPEERDVRTAAPRAPQPDALSTLDVHESLPEAGDGSGEGGSQEISLKEIARQCSTFSEDDWEGYESAVALAASKQMQQEWEECCAKHADDRWISIVYLDPPLMQRLERVRQHEETTSLDGTLHILLDGYCWLYRGGSLPRLPPRVAAPLSLDDPPLPHAIRQSTLQRLVSLAPAIPEDGVEQVIEQVLERYEWVMAGGLAKHECGCSTGERAADDVGAWLPVTPELKSSLEQLGKEEGATLEETLVTLLWTYDWFYRSGLCEQVKALASTALSCFELDEDDQRKIEGVMEREKPDDRFRSIQNLYLEHARDLWEEEKKSASG